MIIETFVRIVCDFVDNIQKLGSVAVISCEAKFSWFDCDGYFELG